MTRSVAGLALSALLLTACVSAGEPQDTRETVAIMGTWRGLEADRFAAVLEPFEAVTGIDVQYIGSADFVIDLEERATEGADPPDIAIVPQLGFIEQLADDELLVPLQDDVRSIVLENFGMDESTGGDAGETGEIYAVPFRLSVKSLVWFRPDVFDEFGWEIPNTVSELEDLVDTIQDDTDLAPWCFSIEAGSATGWAATDWVEDLVLNTAGPDTSRDWVAGDVKFADDEIADAFQQFHDLVLATGRSEGGVRTILERPVDEAWDPLLAAEPGCAMYKQADFATSWMPDDIEIGADGTIDFFAFPSGDADERLVVAGGDHVVQFASDDEIDEVMAYLAGSQAPSIWASQGGFIAANPGVSDDVYPEDYRAAISNVVDAADDVVVDASDWMPPEVGANLFWEQITLWIGGAIDYDSLAETLDEALAEARESRD